MNNKKTIRKAAIIYALLYFTLFLIFYLPNYVPILNEFVEASFKTPYIIIRGVLETTFQFFIPVSAAAVLFAISSSEGRRGVLKSAIFLALPVTVYSLPYCYLYALSLGFDSIEGAGISLAFTLCSAAFEYAHAVLLFLAASFISERAARGRAFGEGDNQKSVSVQQSATDRFSIKSAFDLSVPLTFAVIVISLCELVYNLILEIIDTVSFFVESGGSFTSTDVLDIVFSYLFLLLTMLICHTLSCFMAQRALEVKEDAEI